MSDELTAENMNIKISPLFTFKSRGNIFKDLSLAELMQANQSGHTPTGIMNFILATRVKI